MKSSSVIHPSSNWSFLLPGILILILSVILAHLYWPTGEVVLENDYPELVFEDESPDDLPLPDPGGSDHDPKNSGDGIDPLAATLIGGTLLSMEAYVHLVPSIKEWLAGHRDPSGPIPGGLFVYEYLDPTVGYWCSSEQDSTLQLVAIHLCRVASDEEIQAGHKTRPARPGSCFQKWEIGEDNEGYIVEDSYMVSSIGDCPLSMLIIEDNSSTRTDIIIATAESVLDKRIRDTQRDYRIAQAYSALPGALCMTETWSIEGARALAEQMGTFDLIVLDGNLGEESTTQIFDLFQTIENRVVLHSSESDFLNKAKASNPGFSDFVRKSMSEHIKLKIGMIRTLVRQGLL